MISRPRVSWGHVAFQAVAAGIAGGALFNLYVWVTTLLPQHGGIVARWQWVASTALGKVAFTDPAYAFAGAAIALVAGIAWAAGYAYLAATLPAATRRWIVSGIVYGLIVYTIVQVILLADNNFTYPPTPNAFINGVFACVAFFGLPVAYVVRVLQTRTIT